MAIGTIAAIGIGASAIGGALSASSNKKAAGKAADASLQAAQENNALARETYAKNEGYLSPYIGTGQVAGNYLNAFLGLPQSAPQFSAEPVVSGAPKSALFSSSAPNIVTSIARSMFPAAVDRINGAKAIDGKAVSAGAISYQAPAPVTQADAQNAFGNYIANSDYGFQFATGSNQVNSGYAGAGSLQSGAAMKALEKYRQNLQSGYRTEYTSALGNQQGVGLSAGSALAGVGQNYVNTISANNNNAANAAGNAALIKGQNNPFASVLGTLGGAAMGFGG